MRQRFKLIKAKNSTANHDAHIIPLPEYSRYLEPELEIDKHDGRGVGAEAEAELVELLGVGDVAGQTNTSWRRTPEQELKVVLIITSFATIFNTVTHPKKMTMPCQRAVQNQRRNSLLLIIRF